MAKVKIESGYSFTIVDVLRSRYKTKHLDQDQFKAITWGAGNTAARLYAKEMGITVPKELRTKTNLKGNAAVHMIAVYPIKFVPALCTILEDKMASLNVKVKPRKKAVIRPLSDPDYRPGDPKKEFPITRGTIEEIVANTWRAFDDTLQKIFPNFKLRASSNTDTSPRWEDFSTLVTRILKEDIYLAGNEDVVARAYRASHAKKARKKFKP